VGVGGGLSGRGAGFIWGRLADSGRATVFILRSSVRVSLPITLSAKSSTALAVKEFGWLCQSPPSRNTGGGKANPADRSGRWLVRWSLLQARMRVRNRYC